jgi:hypothetical protein
MHDSITFRSEKKYERKQGKLTARRHMQQIVRHPVEISTGVTVVFYNLIFVVHC